MGIIKNLHDNFLSALTPLNDEIVTLISIFLAGNLVSLCRSDITKGNFHADMQLQNGIFFCLLFLEPG